MSVILSLIGITVFINGFFNAIVSNFNIGTVATLGLGLFLALWGLLFKKIKKLTQKGVWKVIKYLVITLMIWN